MTEIRKNKGNLVKLFTITTILLGVLWFCNFLAISIYTGYVVRVTEDVVTFRGEYPITILTFGWTMFGVWGVFLAAHIFKLFKLKKGATLNPRTLMTQSFIATLIMLFALVVNVALSSVGANDLYDWPFSYQVAAAVFFSFAFATSIVYLVFCNKIRKMFPIFKQETYVINVKDKSGNKRTLSVGNVKVKSGNKRVLSIEEENELLAEELKRLKKGS